MSGVVCVPPFRGELGIMIRYHVPAVRALPRPVVVCHERGYEALYPDCKRIHVTKRPDPERRWAYERDADFVEAWEGMLRSSFPNCRIVKPDDREDGRAERRFLPTPYRAQRNGHPPPDVVICPRKREYAAERNWDGWPAVAEGLDRAGLRIFAAGARRTSYTDLVAHERAWDHERTLDACIEAMRSARLVISTDAGLAHLAVLCGTPLILVGAEGGKAAPGPLYDEGEPIEGTEYWPIRLREYYHKANHTGARIEMLPDGWGDPSGVVRRATEVL